MESFTDAVCWAPKWLKPSSETIRKGVRATLEAWIWAV